MWQPTAHHCPTFPRVAFFWSQVVNVHIPMDLSMLRRLIRKRQGVLVNLGRAIAEKGVRGEEQYHYTGEKEALFTVGG